MNRIAAEYVFTLDEDKPIRNGFVEFDEDGTVTSVGECTAPESETDFVRGAIVP